MAESIIIESNRQLSIKDELKSQLNTDINQGFRPLRNDEWTTNISGDIQIKTGDQIQVETCSIQTLGSPDSEIEFSGTNNTTNVQDLVDNKATIEVGFYITNRSQFNANLPLNGMQIQDANPLNRDWFLPDLYSYDNFKLAYPFEKIEGFSYSNGSYNKIDGGLLTNEPFDMKYTSAIRFSLGDDSFPGFNQSDWAYKWEKRTTNINLDVGTGFKSPSNIGEIITSQLHKQDDETLNFDISGYAQLVGNKNYEYQFTPSLADNCYKNIVTTTGDVFKARTNGNWNAVIPGENGNEGDNYDFRQGYALLYNNLLVGNPIEWNSACYMMSTRDKNFSKSDLPATFPYNLPESQIETLGNYTETTVSNNIGQLGVFHCLNDILNVLPSTNNPTYPTGRTTSATVTNCVKSEVAALELIVTNTPYNEVNINRLARFLKNNKTPDENTPLTPQTSLDESWRYYTTKLNVGRANDRDSIENRKVMSPNIYLSQNPTATVENSYQKINNQTCLIGGMEFDSYDRHHFNVYSNWDDFFAQPTATSFPRNTRFSLRDLEGKTYPTTLSKEYDCAVVPVFFKFENEAIHPYNVPFCAYINKETVGTSDTDRIVPYINQGEFLGPSPNFFDNRLSKIVSTQKKDDSTEVTKNTYRTETTPDTYATTVSIGSQNPTLSFDDTVSKFSITNFHTPVYGSNGSYIAPLADPNSAIDEVSMCINNEDAFISCIDYTNNPIAPPSRQQFVVTPVPNKPDTRFGNIISAQSGITLESIQIPDKNGNLVTLNSESSSVNYAGTLFHKLGFELEQLLPISGNFQNVFNRTNNSQAQGNDVSLLQKTNNIVSPFTTNAYISGADQLSLGKFYNGLSSGNIGSIANLLPVYIECVSDALIATNPPTKLDYPYLTISSDIVPSTLYYGSSGSKTRAMAYVNRSFQAGDFFFGSVQNWSYTSDQDYNISSIRTSIRLPNGDPAPIDSNSSVIYKITRQKTLPPQIEKKD